MFLFRVGPWHWTGLRESGLIPAVPQTLTTDRIQASAKDVKHAQYDRVVLVSVSAGHDGSTTAGNKRCSVFLNFINSQLRCLGPCEHPATGAASRVTVASIHAGTYTSARGRCPFSHPEGDIYSTQFHPQCFNSYDS